MKSPKKSVKRPPQKAKKRARPATEVISRLTNLRQKTKTWRDKGQTIALVPTMGALHDGHMALVKRACQKADRTVVSIFINPTQFAPGEDLDRYPRDKTADVAELESAGVDAIWAPKQSEMYPDDFATHIIPEGAALGLETDHRPHFFKGVATVVCKLFNQVVPDIAVFGEKDYQQLCVVNQLVRDLDLPIKIIAVSTVREKDGLALSSRNEYFDEEQRAIAPALNRALHELSRQIADGADPSTARAVTTIQILADGFDKVDYVAVRDAKTLADYDPKSAQPGRILAAAWLDGTRLIDNIGFKPPVRKKNTKRKR